MTSPRWDIYVGPARQTLETFPDNTFHLAVTSPPYWSQRRYDASIEKELGHEDTPGEFAQNLVDELRPLRAKLRMDGKFYLNIGDTMMGSGGAGGDHNKGGSLAKTPKYEGSGSKLRRAREQMEQDRVEGLGIDLVSQHIPADKSLALVPMRVALGLSDDGWIVRQDIIWQKRNGKPEGVRDRPSRSHEYIFLCALSPKYDYDYVAQLEPAAEKGRTRNRRSVWTLSTSNFKGAHFATFSPALIEPMVLATSPVACASCGKPWSAIVVQEGKTAYRAAKDRWDASHPDGPSYTSHLVSSSAERGETHVGGVRDEAGNQATMKNPHKTIVGYEQVCRCKQAGPPVRTTVIDPFSGASSAGVAALAYGRNYVGIELNPDFAHMAADRLRQEFPHIQGTLHI